MPQTETDNFQEENRGGFCRRHPAEIILVLFFLLLSIEVIFSIFCVSPEYDELWNLQEYVRQDLSLIFSQVATPNNHILNTVFAHFLGLVFGFSVVVLRFVSYLAFAGLFVMIATAARREIRNIPAQILFAACTLCNGLLLHYAENGRGYMLQTLCIFGVFRSLYRSDTEKSVHRAIAWFLFSAAACLTISNGILYVFAITLLYFCFEHRWKDEKNLIYAGIAFTVVAGAWYLGNLNQFLAGQSQFGEVFHSPADFGKYCWKTLFQSGILLPLLLTAGACFTLKGRKKILVLNITGTAVLIFLSALITKGGPVRCYLPLVPLTMFGAALWIEQLFEKMQGKLQLLTFLLTALVCGIAYHFSSPHRDFFRDPDIMRIFSGMYKELPQNIVPVYRTTDCMVLHFEFQDIPCTDYQNRLAAPDTLMVLGENAIGTLTYPDFLTRSFPAGPEREPDGFAGEKMPFWKYRLRPVTEQNLTELKGRTVLCLIRSKQHQTIPGNFFAVNYPLTLETADTHYPLRSLFAANGSDIDPAVLRKSMEPGIMDFYLLEP